MTHDAIERVHVVFKTHLDLGFTDLASVVEQRYRTQFIPRAIDLAEELAASGDETFIWTTGSWLIDMSLRTGTPDEIARLERAIEAGHVAWHALPLTTHSELMDADLFRFGISNARRLDERFGRRTIAAKMTDVPGHTQGIVSLLADAGVEYLHLGVNPASPRPDVPRAFRWVAPDGSLVVVDYAESYGAPSVIPGARDVLEFAHTGDNSGPPAADDVRAVYAELRRKYPGATVAASTLDRYARAILRHAEELPTVTDEIGDSWIHGAATDPVKVARFRELLRLRREWIAGGALIADDAEYREMSEQLLLVAEHTWGLDVKTWLPDFIAWNRPDFAAARAHDTVDDTRVPEKYSYISGFTLGDGRHSTDDAAADLPRSFSRIEESWAEQRAYVTRAVDRLSEPRRSEALARLAALAPHPASPVGTPVRAGERVAFGAGSLTCASDGSLTSLTSADGREWVDGRFGAFRYETFGPQDYERFAREYLRNRVETSAWADPDFTKPGIELIDPLPEHRVFTPTVRDATVVRSDDRTTVTLRLVMPDEAVAHAGAPRRVDIAYATICGTYAVDITLQWFDKPANRLPEASWLGFAPRVATPTLWEMDKLGHRVSPLRVVRDGNRGLHAVGTGVHYRGDDAEVQIETFEAPLVAPGEGRLLHFDNRLPDLSQGWDINLHNNVWGTNFPMWFGEDAMFRFRVTMR